MCVRGPNPERRKEVKDGRVWGMATNIGLKSRGRAVKKKKRQKEK